MQTMYLKITEECNLHCPFCYVDHKNGVIDIDYALEQIEIYKPQRLIFHGGEPGLYKETVLSIINAFPNIETSITTNLMYEIDDTMFEILKRCEIATSYSVDRFTEDQFHYFRTNIHKVNKIKNITLLVTLSQEQLKQPAKKLVDTIMDLNPHDVTFERVRIDSIKNGEDYRSLYEQTDLYLYQLFELMPQSKNNLLHMMKNAIYKNTSVFSTECDRAVVTISPDKKISSCPNGSITKQKRKECLTCDFYHYCKLDCLSFNIYGCSFPKKTFLKVKGMIKKDGIY